MIQMQAGNQLLVEADEVAGWSTPPGDAQFRNRFLKTTLRQNLTGPFLYLDSDTFVRGSLTEVFALQADVAGTPNHSMDDGRRQVWQGDRETLAELGWQTGPGHYLNAGVVFLNDTAAARAFAERWHHLWLEACARLGRSRDQPAFNAALCATGPALAVLPHRFNAQFCANPSVARDAVVWHYYGSNQGPSANVLQSAAERLALRQERDHSEVLRLAALALPWRRENWLDGWMLRWVSRKKKLSSSDLLWLRGRRLESLRQRVGLAPRKTKPGAG